MSDKLPTQIKRWTAQRRTELILSLIRGETSVNEAARKYDLKASDIQLWQDMFLEAGTCGLKSNPNDALVEKDKKISQLHRKIGEMTMDIEVLQEVKRRAKTGPPAIQVAFGYGDSSTD